MRNFRIMADKLIFPIGFDLEAGVNEAVKNIDATLIRIERRIKDKPLELKISGLSELDQSIKTLTESLARLNTVFAATANMQQQLTNSTQEQGKITANTSNTISRQLMEQERLNKALRDVYSEQARVNALLDRYHDTYDGQVESLIRLNNALEANKQAQKDNEKALKDHSITSAEFYARQKELTAQYRQLTQEKRVLTQIMTAEEKAMIAQEGSYVQLSQQLSLLKKAYKDLGEEGRNSTFGQDLEGAIQNLDAHLKDMAADMGEFQRNVGNYAIAGQNGVVATESLIAAINQEARTTQDLIDQTRILEEAKRMINKEDANYQTTLAALNAKLDENRRKLADVSDILGKEAKSVAEAEAQNKRLSEAMKHIDLTSSDAKKKLEEMRSQIERNNRTISAATGANERYAESVLGLVGVNANFGRSLQGLGNGGNFIDGLGIKIKALGKSIMGLLANPWVLAILGIAGVAAGFKWWYEYNKGLIEASRLTENFTGLTGEAADKITADMQTLADHMGKGYKESIGAANVLVQQFGVSWEEAMKLMQDGIVAGADMSGNMVSNIERFAPALRDAGVSADEFMSILAETRNGVFNEQGIQDIVKGGTRLRAMTRQIAESLDAVGISSAQMQKDLSDGTITMFDAVQTVAAKLKELPENSQEAGNIMKHVFGRTASEGGTLLIQSIADVNTNLDEAKNRMGELGKANEEQMNAQRELNEALSAVFKVSGTNFEIMIAKVKTFVAQGLTKVIKGCADIVNWFIRMYNKSIVVRAGVSSIVNSFKTLWEISKFVFNQIIDSFTAAGTILEGIVTLDWDKVKKGYTDGMKALGNNITTLAKNIASNTADAFNDTLNGQMKEVSVKLDADTSGATPVRDVSGDGNSGGITPIGGKVDKEAAKSYLQTLNKIEQSLSTIYTKYTDLEKKEGATKALGHINELYKTQLAYINELGKQFGLSFKMPTSFKDLQSYRSAILDVINKLKASGIKGAENAALDFEMKIGLGNIDDTQKQIEAELKRLADRISRTKTAKGFYEKILGMTGDYSLASKVADSIFGQNGSALQKALADQVRGMTNGIALPDDIISADNIIDYKALRQFAEANKDELGKMYDELIKIADNGEKELTKNFEGYLKDLDVAKTYADKRVELARTTAAKIREIEQQREIAKKNGKDTKVYDDLIRRYQEREDREAAKLEYEAFKDTPLYVQMFEDLEHASTSTLEMMKQRLEGLSRVWGTALDPTQLKEIQSRMNEIDSQLRERNPFKTLKKSYQQYRDAVKSVSLQGAAENAGAAAKEHYDMSRDYGADSAQARAAEKELKAREKIVEIARKVTAENKKGAKALDAAAQIANDNLKIARGHLELAAAEEQALRDKSTYENPDQDPKVIAAHEAVEAAKEEVNLAERVAEITTNNAKTAKTLKENFASAANQVVKYMGMAGDLAHAVADTMEALGGDEEDVQFWNDIGEAIGDLTAGFQGLIESVKSANVAGVISNAIGIIPNMVKGFVGLFTAGKVRKANKEIKSQQKLLDQLEYTYGRLEKAADKLFGHEYLNNYNQQLKILQAQQQAYLKQAEAERSKGKKKDEEKIKEYENQARDTADKIIELQDDLVSQIVGTDVASAARDFANAWLDAYLSFGSTTDAIKEKFDDMIKNMIVNMVLAQVVKRALQPIFDMIDELAKDGDLSAADISKVMSRVPQTMQDINNGLSVGVEGLKAAGVNIDKLRKGSSEFSGIAKSVAGATSEEINNVAAIGNTLMYYVSPIPRMDENLARIRAIMENGAAATATTSAASTGWTDWQQQAMDNYTAIQRNTADTVVECRRAANACEKFAKAIVQKGATAGLNVFLKN